MAACTVGWLSPKIIWLPSCEFEFFMATHKKIRANPRDALKHGLRAALLPGQDEPDPQPHQPKSKQEFDSDSKSTYDCLLCLAQV